MTATLLARYLVDDPAVRIVGDGHERARVRVIQLGHVQQDKCDVRRRAPAGIVSDESVLAGVSSVH